MLKVCESCGRATRRVRAKYPGCLRCGAASWESAESILGNRLIVLWFCPDRHWHRVPLAHWPLAIVRAGLSPDFDGEWTETRIAGDLFAYQSAAQEQR